MCPGARSLQLVNSRIMNVPSRDMQTGLPRLRLATLPTPCETAPRLAEALDLASLCIKREDLSGYALGGNKLRQLDFILAEALEAGAEMLVSTAGSQSNFCRSLAGAAAKLGLGCHLLLRESTGRELQGNLLLDDIFGAEVSFTSATDPWDPAIRQALDDIAVTYRAAGRNPFIVQLTGVSVATGGAAWFSAVPELLTDFERFGEPDIVVVAAGSGLTLAGLALGLKCAGSHARLVGVSAQQPASRLVPLVCKTAETIALRLGLAERLHPQDFEVIDTEIPPGYGRPSPASVAAVRLAGRTEALVLDPVYTGKALAGLAAAVASGRYGAETKAFFVHSGGTPGLFMHDAAFAGGSRAVPLDAGQGG